MTERTPPHDSRKLHVPAPGSAATGPAARPPSPRPPRAEPLAAAGRSTGDEPKATAPPTRTPPARPGTKGRPGRLPRRPKLRRVLFLTSLILPIALVLVALGGWLYVRSAYAKVEKIPLADVLSPASSGTNYLIVGSDTRDPQALLDAGLNPGAFDDGGGQRSDTMMLLRFVDGQAKMLSIPRDLYVPIAETNGSAKINAAYNGGGPRRLILTIEKALQVPVNHYMEIDFVSFAGLVDALGGITIDFPNPASDANTGLNITTAGPNRLAGPDALAYVRSRYYVEVINGRKKEDPTADLGRVQRQQQFLRAVFSKLGATRNPVTLVRAGAQASSGLRVDDTLGMVDALRLAWRLRSLDPAPVVLPTRFGQNKAGAVLFRVDPEAEAALAEFR